MKNNKPEITLEKLPNLITEVKLELRNKSTKKLKEIK